MYERGADALLIILPYNHCVFVIDLPVCVLLLWSQAELSIINRSSYVQPLGLQVCDTKSVSFDQFYDE